MTPLDIQLLGIAQQLILLLVAAFPMHRVLVAGKFWSSVGYGYLLFAAWGFGICMLLPLLLSGLAGDTSFFPYFPESPWGSRDGTFWLDSQFDHLYDGAGVAQVVESGHYEF